MGIWRGPLRGIPIAFQDLVHTAQVPTEAGSRVLEEWPPPFDATVLRRLRAAGAINVGKTHTHEFAYGVNIPPTCNPWNLDSYPCGSSAGSAVAVAVRSAFAAVGTDGGGSIRRPAALNGVVTLKPTTGRVGRHGVVPLTATFDTVGPIPRTVEDCALLFQAWWVMVHSIQSRTSRADWKVASRDETRYRARPFAGNAWGQVLADESVFSVSDVGLVRDSGAADLINIKIAAQWPVFRPKGSAPDTDLEHHLRHRQLSRGRCGRSGRDALRSSVRNSRSAIRLDCRNPAGRTGDQPMMVEPASRMHEPRGVGLGRVAC